MYPIKQSTTAQKLLFLMVQSSDHISGLTGASPTVTLSKNGGSFSSPSGAVSEVANGWYVVAGNATDTNTLGPLVLHATAASGDPTDVCYHVVAYDPQDAVHLGLSALPNTAVTSNASLITSGSGTDQLTVSGGIASADAKKINAVSTSSVTTVNANQGTTQPVNFTGTAGSALVKSDMVDVAGSAVSTSSAQIGVNAVNIGGTAQTGRDMGASVLLSAGTGTGQLDFTSGVVKANLAQILGTALTETAGQIAAAFKKFFNIASPTSTMNEITLVDSVNGAVGSVTAAVSITGDLSSTMKTSVTTAVWDATASSHTTAGSTGAALVAAGAAGDPWATTLPGSYGTSTAGNILGNKLDATVSSRYPTSDAGASLTSLGDAHIAHLDADISSRASPAQILTTALTESYVAKGGTLTLAQGIYGIHQYLYERGVVGTTETIKKRDQSTTAKTLTLDNSTNPTAVTETS